MAKTASKSNKAAPSGGNKPGRKGTKKKVGKSVASRRVVVDPVPGRDPFKL
jgi:hypothetical protein